MARKKLWRLLVMAAVAVSVFAVGQAAASPQDGSPMPSPHHADGSGPLPPPPQADGSPMPAPHSGDPFSLA